MWWFWLLGFLIFIKIYNKLSTGKCYADTVMSGKVVIITGANRGIGFETALDLARRGAKVILACRDDKNGKEAADSIIRITKNKFVRYEYLDLSSLASIRKFVERFRNSEAKLDVLINNAGCSCLDRSKTSDGIIRGMQVNHFGPFLLTVLLTPILKNSVPSRVINISSSFHRFGTIEGLNEGRYGWFGTYCNSKLCNILFSNELARRLEGTGVVVNSLHPGQVNTSFYRDTGFFERLRCLVLFTFLKTPWEGAQTTINLAISDDYDYVSGKYFVDCEESDLSDKALDKNLAAKLWAISEDLVRLRSEERISY